MIGFIKRYKDYFWVILGSFLLILTLFWINGCITGKVTLVTGDTVHQYFPLFSQLKEILNGNQSLFYAWNKGIGGNFLGTFFYYLASPLNLLVVFFGENQFHYFLLLLISIKIVLATLTMYHYLKKHFPTSFFSNFFFAITYAFSSYAIGYCFNIMWLDALYLLPIVLLGIEKLVDKKKISLYVISLFFTIFCNYYIGYMVCLFSCLYFFYYLFLHYSVKTQKKEIWNTCILFFVVSFLTGMLCFFFLLPCGIEFLESSHTLTLSPEVIYTTRLNNWNFFSFFFMNGDQAEILNNHIYYVYASILIFPLCLTYFFHKNISKKEKKLTFLFFLIFILSICIPFLDKIWHMFSSPISYTGRYTFLFIFFSIFIAVRSFEQMKTLENKYFLFLAPIFPILGLLYYLMGTLSLGLIYVSVAIYLFYLIILANLKRPDSKVLVYFLGVFVIAEVCFSSSWILQSIIKETSYQSELTGYYEALKEEIDVIQKEAPSDFYRIYEGHNYTSNPGMYLQYNGVDLFLSTSNKNLIDFFTRIAYFKELQSTHYAPFNRVFNTLLGIRYLIVDGYEREGIVIVNNISYPQYPILFKHEIASGHNYAYGVLKTNSYILENPYVLPLGFLINNRSLEEKNLDLFYDTFALSNYLINQMLAEDINPYEEITFEKRDNSYKIKYDTKEPIYMSVKEKRKTGISFEPSFSNDKTNWEDFLAREKYETELPYTETEYTLYYKEKSNKELEIHFYKFNAEKLKQAVEKLKEKQLHITKQTPNSLEGEITVEEAQTLFLSIINEKGWKLYVDGKEKPIETVYNAFIGIPLEKGNHTIVLKFTPPFLKISSLVSIISLILLLYLSKFSKKKLTAN